MNRRGFLGGMLAAMAAPAIVRAESLMTLWVPKREILLPMEIGEWQDATMRGFLGGGHAETFEACAIDVRFRVGSYDEREQSIYDQLIARHQAKIERAFLDAAIYGVGIVKV